MHDLQDRPPASVEGLDPKAIAGLKALLEEHPRFAVPDPDPTHPIGEFAFSNRVKSPDLSFTNRVTSQDLGFNNRVQTSGSGTSRVEGR